MSFPGNVTTPGSAAWRRLAERSRAPLIGTVLGAAIALSRLSMQSGLKSEAPFLMAWPAIMIAAYIGGFWPAIIVNLISVGVAQMVMAWNGQPLLGAGAILIYMIFGLVFAVAGGWRKRMLRSARADADRLGEMQAKLMNVARLNAMGEMAGTLAHELNQPLTALLTYAGAARRIVERGDPPEGKFTELLTKITDQALRARDIIARVRAHVGSAEMELTAVSISKMFNEAVPVAIMGVGENAPRVRQELDANLDSVLADRIQVQQVILNLVRNASEAMAGSPVRELRIASRLNDDGLVEIHVADTGPGIAPAIAAQLFEPFVTGKADGMGIGLSMSRNIIEAHGGKLWAEAPNARGATFKFTLKPSLPPEMAGARPPR